MEKKAASLPVSETEFEKQTDRPTDGSPSCPDKNMNYDFILQYREGCKTCLIHHRKQTGGLSVIISTC